MRTESGFSDALLQSRIRDAANLAGKHGTAQFIGFLDERQSMVAQACLKRERIAAPYAFWGGYPDARRNVLGIFPPGEECRVSSFPVVLLEAKYRCLQGCLTHRDFLGALMALGIKREVLGDILPENGHAVLFVWETIADYLIAQVEMVGRTRISFSRNPQAELPSAEQFESITGTVASARLDCILSCMLKLGRASAADLVQRKLVMIDFAECTNISKTVTPGQTLSVRGFGRFFVESIGPVTRKGRLAIKIKKYR